MAGVFPRHNETVDDDYSRAMSSVERRLELLGKPEEKQEILAKEERNQVLMLTAQLAEPELRLETRLDLVAQIRFVLLKELIVPNVIPNNERRQQDHPPPSLFFLGQS
jgi:hypothetical protein